MRGNPLRLHHELLLLALHDEKGTLAFGQMIAFGLGGAIFTELLLDGHARIVEEGGKRRKKFVELTGTPATADLATTAAVQKMAIAKRRASPSDTVARIAGIRGLWQLVATDLAHRNVLRETEQEILLLFRRRVYPTLDPQPERALIARVRKAMDGSGAPDARTAALIGLADTAGSLSAIYTRSELRALRKRIKAIRESDVGSRAAREAVEAAAAATAAASAAMVMMIASSG